ncbi:MAG: DnaD domain protein [Acutalibacteraceae bacterium]
MPAAVVDQHLRLCGVLQLKVLLLLLRQGRAMSDQEIAAFLRQDPADIRDAALYWENCGLLRSEGDSEHAAAQSGTGGSGCCSSPENGPGGAPPYCDRGGFPPVHPGEVRGAGCPGQYALMSLLHKAQEIIGSTLTSMDMQCLTALYAYYGLSPELSSR